MKKNYYPKNLEIRLPREVIKLEFEDNITSNDVFYHGDYDVEGFNPYAFLYHGIRFDNNLIKLENILKEKKIFAGKYINGYYNYSDNANKGEYVSLTAYSEDRISGFDVFVKENICLLVSPNCGAILTKYVDFNTWEKIKDIKTRNIYSYMAQEFMVKDYVSFDFIKAIGVPYRYLVFSKGKEYADDVLLKVENLMKKYDVNLNVVDINSYNKILIEKRNVNLKR